MRIGLRTHIGPVIKDLRKRLGLSQAQYSELAGVPQPTLSRLESGRIQEPSMALVARIVGAVGTDLNKVIHDLLARAKGPAKAARKGGARTAARKGARGTTRGRAKRGARRRRR